MDGDGEIDVEVRHLDGEIAGMVVACDVACHAFELSSYHSDVFSHTQLIGVVEMYLLHRIGQTPDIENVLLGDDGNTRAAKRDKAAYPFNITYPPKVALPHLDEGVGGNQRHLDALRAVGPLAQHPVQREIGLQLQLVGDTFGDYLLGAGGSVGRHPLRLLCKGHDRKNELTC